MNFKYAMLGMAVGLVFISAMGWAQPGNVNNHNCNGRDSCSDGGGDGQPQTVSQSSVNTVTNDSVSSSDSRAYSDSSSVSNSGGNNLVSTGGESRASSTASGGVAQSTSGGSVSAVTFEQSASSAASVFAGYCSSGASGQLTGGGFSVSNSEQFCDYLRLADIMWQAYQRETADCRCEGVCTFELASVEMICVNGEESQKFLAAYRENIWAAHDLLQTTEATAKVGRIAGQVITPMSLLLAVAMLL